MSLINKMLKDLDKRKAEDKNMEGQSGVPPKLPPPPPPGPIRPSFFRRYGYLIILLLIAAILAYYFLKETKPKPTVKPVPEIPAPQAILTPKPPPVTPAPTQSQVLSSQWEDINNGGRLTLYLSHLAHYEMKKITETHIELILRNTKFAQDALLQLPKENKIFSAINLISDDKKSTLEIQLKQPGHVSTVEVGEADKSLKIELNIVEPTPEPSKVESDEKTIVPLSREEIAQQEYSKIMSQAASISRDKTVLSLNEYVKRFPNYSKKAYASLATYQLLEGHTPTALLTIDAGLSRYPDSLDLSILKARILILLCRPAEALAVLDPFSPEIKANTNFYAIKAIAELHTRHYPLAESYYAQIVQLDPSQSSWWLGLAISLEQQNKLAQARFAYTKALQSGHLSPASQAFANAKLDTMGL